MSDSVTCEWCDGRAGCAAERYSPAAQRWEVGDRVDDVVGLHREFVCGPTVQRVLAERAGARQHLRGNHVIIRVIAGEVEILGRSAIGPRTSSRESSLVGTRGVEPRGSTREVRASWAGVEADIPDPRDHMASRYQGIARAPVGQRLCIAVLAH